MKTMHSKASKFVFPAVILYVALIWLSYDLVYPRLELLIKGETASAEIIGALERHSNRNTASSANRHLVTIDGVSYELVLQDRFSAGNVDILWVWGKTHAVVTDKNGEYSIIALLGGTVNTFYIVLSLWLLFYLPYIALRNRKHIKNQV